MSQGFTVGLFFWDVRTMLGHHWFTTLQPCSDMKVVRNNLIQHEHG